MTIKKLGCLAAFAAFSATATAGDDLSPRIRTLASQGKPFMGLEADGKIAIWPLKPFLESYESNAKNGMKPAFDMPVLVGSAGPGGPVKLGEFNAKCYYMSSSFLQKMESVEGTIKLAKALLNVVGRAGAAPDQALLCTIDTDEFARVTQFPSSNMQTFSSKTNSGDLQAYLITATGQIVIIH